MYLLGKINSLLNMAPATHTSQLDLRGSRQSGSVSCLSEEAGREEEGFVWFDTFKIYFSLAGLSVILTLPLCEILLSIWQLYRSGLERCLFQHDGVDIADIPAIIVLSFLLWKNSTGTESWPQPWTKEGILTKIPRTSSESQTSSNNTGTQLN